MVGSKMHEYAAAFFSDSKKALWLAFIVGCICSIFLIFFSTSVYRDSVIYSSMVQDFNLGDWDRFINGRIPPLFPFLAGMLCKLGLPVYYASMIVGCVFCVITIFPLFGLLSFFMDKKYAAWGALLYMLAPKTQRLGLAVLLESGKFFFLTSALYLTFSFYHKRKLMKLIYLGFALACLAMYRSEGIIYFPIIFAGLFLMLLKDNDYRLNFQFVKKFILYVLLVATVLLVVLSPRFYQIYKQTGFPALDARGAYAIEIVINKFLAPSDRFELLDVNNPKAPQDPTSGSFNFAWVSTSKHQHNFIESFVRGSYEPYLVLAVIGMVLIIKRRKWEMEHTFLLWLLLANTLFFYIFTAVAIRYFLINIIFLMPFTIIGFTAVFDWMAPNRLQKFSAVLLLFLSIVQLVNGMNNCRTDALHCKELGQWLKANQSHLKITGNADPFTVMIFGDDYGLGLWSGSNIIRNSSFRNEKPVPEIKDILNGFPAKKCSFIIEKMPDKKILRPDVIVVFNPENYKREIETFRHMPRLEELHTKWDSQTVVFKNKND